MDEMSPRLQGALAKVSGSWDDGRTARTLRGLKRKRMRRRLTRASMSAGLVAAVVLLTVKMWPSPTGDAVAPTVAVAAGVADAAVVATADGVVLDDGTIVTPAADSTIEVVASTSESIEVAVMSGRGRFEVPADHRRRVIHAGGGEISVYSAVFSVASYADAVEVEVDTGEVEVLFGGRVTRLGQGQSRRFAIATEPRPEPALKPALKPAPERATASRDWRALARDGELAAAYNLLRKSKVGDDVADLLLAADVYRMSGHPAHSVRHLEQVVDLHPADARASLAAFTLGRVLLDDLGRPAAAAQAFSRARSFAPDGALAEDALAREVEAWSKAGKAGRARARAEQYLERYPRGHRLRAVKQYGHL